MTLHCPFKDEVRRLLVDMTNNRMMIMETVAGGRDHAS